MKTIRQTSFPVDPYILVPSDVGQAIKAARTQAGLRIVDAALAVGVSLQTMVNVEAGKPGVSLGIILKAADALGVSLFAVPTICRDQFRNQITSLSTDGQYYSE